MYLEKGASTTSETSQTDGLGFAFSLELVSVFRYVSRY